MADKKYQIIESDHTAKDVKGNNAHFYYLLEIDKDGNQTVITQDDDLSVVQSHELVKGRKLQPIEEEKTRGLITDEDND